MTTDRLSGRGGQIVRRLADPAPDRLSGSCPEVVRTGHDNTSRTNPLSLRERGGGLSGADTLSAALSDGDTNRTSSLPNGSDRGRPSTTDLATYRAVFPEWSERTIARYAVALRRMEVLRRFGLDRTEEVIRRATRANGSLNVAALCAMSEDIAAMWLARNTAGNPVMSYLEVRP